LDPRVETHSQPERDGRGECDSREIVASQFVVAGSDAAEVLEPAEHRLDSPAITIASLVILDRPLAIAPAGDDRDGTLLTERRAQPVGIIAPVSDQALHADQFTYEQVSPLYVGRVPRCQCEAQRSSEDIDEGVDFRRPATARDANGLGSSPPFAPPEQRCAFT
jgi:hypothetical protein